MATLQHNTCLWRKFIDKLFAKKVFANEKQATNGLFSIQKDMNQIG